MMGAKTLEAQIADGTAKVGEGDAGVLKQLAATMVDSICQFDQPDENMQWVDAHATRSRAAATSPPSPGLCRTGDAARGRRIIETPPSPVRCLPSCLELG